ncbi:YhcH/YjgK/YiaL family protein [Campylobacter jejuni]|uniref:YhcH/YjgK/YiaL family protein n=1 Tax=Campylobacter jejuni TaxID=197 RepID=UPI000F80B9C0|nr:YhcH/YjgK/YiaL family protein [Campylobacter jejuni]EAH7997208.1 DUF386 family protein [Campylobacter jejuni]EEA6214309.1 DUF386 domain-containing protein [Campylobacter jejuni]EIP7640690.1 YhcH/YjgK/YiaL family protein [Campylobacter jejuni]EIP7641295.1 YhcH/YjgK/YiaL family protein [Campylobacter jejuni]MGG33620.1 DUF386 domain-containing protein [Campylobacter jejuni]
MAIITNIEYIQYFFNDSIALKYLYSVCKNGHKNQIRIFNLPLNSFKKEPITDNLFALEQNYITKSRADCFWESHKQYIDIQLHLSGIEQMEFNNINSFKISKPYDAARDLIIYEDNNYSNKIIMQKNDIAIFFPEDAHLGTAMYNKTPSNILKTVIKYPLRLWR